jgi:opacity protein-like surface antigen
MHEFSAGGQAGVRFGIDGARYWGQDYAYSYGSNAGTITTSAGSFSFPTRFHQVSSNVLFYPWSLDRRQFFPYVTAGVGATFVIVNQDAITEGLHAGMGPLKSETIFAFNAGAGVRIRLNDRVGLRLDWRDYMSRALRYGIQKSSEST